MLLSSWRNPRENARCGLPSYTEILLVLRCVFIRHAIKETSMFTGLSAFPLTPMNETEIDERAFRGLIQRLAAAGVTSLGVLGSTGNYAYLTREERKRVVSLAVEEAGKVPVMVGIGALRTRQVLELAEDAQQAGAKALLLAPVSYQKLREEEVFQLYQSVNDAISVPLCLYDNPGTTQFTFSDELYGRLAGLSRLAAIKIPGVPDDAAQAKARIDRLRQLLPDKIAIGVSGDALAARGLNAGGELWFSVLGGLFPQVCQRIIRLSAAGQQLEAQNLSDRLAPLWALFAKYGSLRVVAALAARLGLTEAVNLPQPLASIDREDAGRLEAVLPLLE